MTISKIRKRTHTRIGIVNDVKAMYQLLQRLMRVKNDVKKLFAISSESAVSLSSFNKHNSFQSIQAVDLRDQM